jgi:hypothetical protein
MKNFILGFVICILVASCTQKTKENIEMAPLLPVEDFFRNPDIAYFTISPDGKTLAFTKPVNQRMNVFATVIGSKDTIQLTNFIDRDVQSYFWKGNKIVYAKDQGGDENFHLYVVDADGKNQKDLTPFAKVNVGVIDGLIEYENELLISMNKENPELFDVYRLNLLTGSITLEAKNPGGVINWITDHTGTIRVAVQSDGVNSVLLYRDNKKQDFKQVLRTTFREGVNPLFFTFDNKFLYATSNLNRDKAALVKFDIANGKELALLYEHPEVDLEGLDYSYKRKVITKADYTTAKSEMKFFDDETEKLYARYIDRKKELELDDEIAESLTGIFNEDDMI